MPSSGAGVRVDLPAEEQAKRGGAGARPMVRVGWTVSTAFAALTAALVIYGAWRTWHGAANLDFVSFWAAGRLALEGAPASAYDITIHRAVELASGGLNKGFMPFPYPPPFLFFVIPFALVPFFPAFIAWVSVTCGLYLWSCRRIAPPPYSLVHSAALVNALIGQNGFLTSAIFIIGTSLLATRPALAGAVLGLLVVKPQLALLLPVAVLAARQWRAVAGAVASSSLLLLAALIVFGLSAYQAFLAILPQYAQFMTRDLVRWNELASIYAFFRFLGAPQQVSLAAQIIVALAAAAVTWRAWSRDLDTKIPILAAATLLLPPYLYHYDTLLLILPIGWYIQKQPRPALVVALWLLCLLPFVGYAKYWPGPNTVPIAAILSIWFLYRDAASGGTAERLSPAAAAAGAAPGARG